VEGFKNGDAIYTKRHISLRIPTQRSACLSHLGGFPFSNTKDQYEIYQDAVYKTINRKLEMTDEWAGSGN
jgi:hypothetical protein